MSVWAAGERVVLDKWYHLDEERPLRRTALRRSVLPTPVLPTPTFHRLGHSHLCPQIDRLCDFHSHLPSTPTAEHSLRPAQRFQLCYRSSCFQQEIAIVVPLRGPPLWAVDGVGSAVRVAAEQPL
eukprot:2079436-Rhodomonas_salina.1